MVNDLSEGEGLWAVLADPTRRQVVQLLSTGSLRPGELAARLGVGRPALSRHLRVLRETGLVSVEMDTGDARGRSYRLDPAPLIGLQAWLEQVQTHWDEQLNSFKTYTQTREPPR